jgi:hypothetical protein
MQNERDGFSDTGEKCCEMLYRATSAIETHRVLMTSPARQWLLGSRQRMWMSLWLPWP